VGIGNSALDISLEAARAGATVVVACRSGTNVIPVADHRGRPIDQMMNTRFYNSLPASLRNALFYRLVYGTNAEFQRSGMPPPRGGAGSQGFSNLKEHVEYKRLLRQGRIRFVAGAIQNVCKKSVTIGTADVEADEVVLCTGYRLSFPFLAPELAKGFAPEAGSHPCLNAYKQVMHPSEHTLCALGFILTYGNESCVGEMQARWALAHWVGRSKLPSASVVAADLQKRQKARKYPQFVPYIGYMDGLAVGCGAAPPLSWATLLMDPLLFWKIQMAPVVPAQYRLAGEHGWPAASDFVRALPTTALRWVEQLWAPPHHAGATPAAPPPPARL